ncbi:hypothetical protein OG585_38165 [Streptomyces sp. NBC_01340]|uniref:hypothetical protein n=1 Tax=unclassified Streptomyces TaxID=2593676 RepID=UPI002252AD89|nr:MULTISPECIES: hypothetical protein [unclassified Streptomyces]MCX4458347.1 hypothetical protein [Streptomyces sp. NBC_01719]MCX4497704.1 hypothetical protein [Streptomyces sp. NBC_01728]MCX4596297.1 hypothetical protein [Streptomyces sp. NBC_01549]WSI42524.1 hypothetical protein OG585_38165 [Streptomyces sp. NBC_01340]
MRAATIRRSATRRAWSATERRAHEDAHDADPHRRVCGERHRAARERRENESARGGRR